jgi:hypothetical protein
VSAGRRIGKRRVIEARIQTVQNERRISPP